MNKARRILFYLFIIALLLLTGYCRDFVFKSINALLQAWDSDKDYYLPASMRFIESYDYDTILDIKWLLTFLFSAVYLAIALLTIRVLFRNRRFLKITIVAYTGIVVLSGIFMLFGQLFRSPDKMYEFARYFMGIAQSPLVLMILLPLFKISEKEQAESRS
jgi:hypothetical protein